MNDLNLLLRAVIENHDEDTPRLMYADAIEERGKPGDAERAEFIRVQVLKTVGEDGRDVWNKAVQYKFAFDWFPKGDIYLSNTDSSPRIWLSAEPGKGGFLERGFLPEITCDAATFLRHADALIWHPEQTMECPECKGHGWTTKPDGCPTCRPKSGVRGTGRVPRPCPPTAQPIRRVVLTTVEWIDNSRGDNDWRIMGYHRSTTHDAVYAQVEKIQASGRPWDIVTAIYECLWPGVEFVLPRTGNVEEPDPYNVLSNP